MSNQHPFPGGNHDPEGTVMIPSPGGRRSGAPAAAASNARGPAPDAGNIRLHGMGLNPLLKAANPLLALVLPLRHMHAYSNLDELRAQLIQAMRNFEAEARDQRVDPDSIAAARYALCTFLDETISSTPWGGNNVWSSRSLLVVFHNEAFGGEKFFLIMQRLAQDPKTHVNVLELMYVCLSLGMEGRYRVIENGRMQLESLRERLQQMIQQQRAPLESDLSPRWRGVITQSKTGLRVVPLWVIAAVVFALVLITQMIMIFMLNRNSDPVFTGLNKLKLDTVVAQPAPPPPPAKPIVRLAGFLEDEIAKKTVDVDENAQRSIVTIRGDGLFKSGSAELMPEFNGLMQRIGDALRTVPGKVVVVGHTDDQKPGAFARYPSNYDLSKARAQTVLDKLKERSGAPERYSVEAKGDAEPLVKNDTPAGRARNRRVDIIVQTPAGK
ncbi:type IVB secretion system protein IcmH/DotU [Massilia sp. W12]|uniref:type IVB secretion system protein IcmH/DotU n=1 Tax=Massilia sp. W12 TaxID=3126507 RepID=UPI0030D1189A